VLARDGRSVAATLGLGLLARDSGDLDAAEAAFRQAAALDPARPEPWLELAEMLRDAGQREAAEAALAAVLARDPAHERAWLGWSLLHRQAGEVESALGDPGALRRGQPGHPRRDGAVRTAARPGGGGDGAARARPGARARAPDGDQRDGRPPAHPPPLDGGAGAAPARHSGAWGRRLAAHRRERRAGGSRPARRGPRRAGRGRHRRGQRRRGRQRGHPAPRPLRRAGLWHEARDLAREATARWPAHGPLWEGRFNLELLVGEEGSVRACLDSMPDARGDDRARLARMRGQWAEARWRLEEARTSYDAALGAGAAALSPGSGWTPPGWRCCCWTAGGAARAGRFVRLDAAAAALQNRPARISHTHLGQILNEYELDAEALDALRAVRPLPPGERIAPTLALVRRIPHSTPVAIAALVALRQAGRLEAGAARPGRRSSPAHRQVLGRGRAAAGTWRRWWRAGPPTTRASSSCASTTRRRAR
jgi:tetratricopeptide (TPR) repeat protein